MVALDPSVIPSATAVWLPPSDWPAASERLFTPGPFQPGDNREPGLITRYDGVREALLNRHGTWSRHVPTSVIPEDDRHCTLSAAWAEDGPTHRVLRGSLSALNRGSSVDARRFTRSRTNELFAELMSQGPPWDLSRVIYQVSMELIIRYTLQAPPLLRHARALRALTREHVSGAGGYFTITRQPEAENILREVIRHYDRLPADGLAAHLVRLMQGGKLTEAQVIAQLWLVCVSQETQATATASLLGMVLQFGELDYVRDILDDDGKMLLLIKEGTRRGIVFPANLVIATEQTELDGHIIAPGTICMASYAAANLDPARFDAPLRFNPRAIRDTPHIAFGEGPHRCQGAVGAEEFMEDMTKAIVMYLPAGVRLDAGKVLREVGISQAVSRLPLVV